jgi:hypothetical protein
MSIAYLLDAGYSTINNKFHNFFDVQAGVIKNTSLNPTLNPTAVAIGVNSLQANPVTGALSLSASAGDATLETTILKASAQVETVIVTTAQINTNEILPNSGDTVTVTGDLDVTGDFLAKTSTLSSSDIDVVYQSINNMKEGFNTQAVTQHTAGDALEQNTTYVGVNGLTMTTSNSLASLSGVGFAITKDDLILQSENGSVRIAYADDKAISVAPSGAVTFNTSCVDSVVTEGSYGTAGQLLVSQGDSAPPQWADAPTPDVPSAWSSYPATQNVDMASHTFTNLPSLDVGSGSITCGTLNYTTLSPAITPYAPFVSSSVLYVDKAGNDTTGSGCQEKPYLTIGKALTTASSLYPARVTIQIANGNYAEDLTITKPNVLLTGVCASSNQSFFVSITGIVIINLTTGGDLHNNQVVFQNLGITGSVSDVTAGYAHTVISQNVRLFGNNTVFAQTTTGADCRTRLYNMVISQDSAGADNKAMILLSAGMSSLTLLDCTAKNNCSVLKIDQSAKLDRVTLCSFTSSTTSATAYPVVDLSVASGSSAVYAFGYCSFSYGSTTNKSANANSCGILMNSSTGNPIVYVVYNSFNLQGTTSSNFAIQDSNAGGATQGVFAFYSNNASIANASAIRGVLGVNKLTLQAVA